MRWPYFTWDKIPKRAGRPDTNEKDEKRKEKMKNSDAKFTMFLSGMILFHTLEDNLFEQEENENE